MALPNPRSARNARDLRRQQLRGLSFRSPEYYGRDRPAAFLGSIGQPYLQRALDQPMPILQPRETE